MSVHFENCFSLLQLKRLEPCGQEWQNGLAPGTGSGCWKECVEEDSKAESMAVIGQDCLA